MIHWLHGKGLTTQQPIHALRKMAGSLIHDQFGIEAARDFLGHADVSTTSNSYLSKRPKVAISFADKEGVFTPKSKKARRAN